MGDIMFSKEKLDSLYDVVIAHEQVTQVILLDAGFSFHEINLFLSQNILGLEGERYIFLDIAALCKYGLELEWKKQLHKAHQVFNYCKHSSPDYLDVYYYPIWVSLRKRSFDKALYDAKILSNVCPTDGKFLMYLLYYLIDVPKEVEEDLSKITYGQVIEEEENAFFRNIKSYVFHQELPHAYQFFNENVSATSFESIRMRVYKILLKECAFLANDLKQRVKSYMENDLLDVAYLLLSSRVEKGCLQSGYYALWSLLHDYMLVRNGYFINFEFQQTDSLMRAILNHDYDRAMELLEIYGDNVGLNGYFKQVITCILQHGLMKLEKRKDGRDDNN